VAEAHGQWTAFGVLATVLRKAGKQPFRAFLLLGLLPALWHMPLDALWPRIRLPRAPASLDQWHYGATAARAVVAAAWGSLIAGGVALAALDVAREKNPRPSRILQGFKHAGGVFMASAASVLLRPLMGRGLWMLSVPLTTVFWIFVVRTAMWVPLLVDQDRPIWNAFHDSWVWTRGAFWKITRLLLLVVLFYAPAAVVARNNAIATFLVEALGLPFFTLALAEVYLLLVPTSVTPVEVLQGIPPDDEPTHPTDPPTSGSGWARNVPRR
jgi:hypothetical protein